MDCNGYDKISRDQITNLQYEAKNPAAEGATAPLCNPITGVPYNVGLDSQITFTRDSKGTDTLVFPGPDWPTPRRLWGLGEVGKPGHDGIFYRYGPDQLVRAYSKSCPDQKFNWVDVGYESTLLKTGTRVKRDETLHPIMQDKVDTYEAKLSEGKTHKQVLKEMAMSECEQAPKNEIDGLFMEWIKMMNHAPEDYDTICDKPSQRLQDKKNTEAKNLNGNDMGTTVPLWLILVASLCSGLVVIGIITVVIITVRRKSDVTDDYRQME